MMGLESLKESVKIAQTRQFIKERQDDVILTRRGKVPDGSGGYKWSGSSTLPAQKMRMIPARSISQDAPVRTTSSGAEVHPSWLLVTMPDADIEIGDTATIRGHSLEVVYKLDVPTNRIVCECAENLDG